MQTLPSSLLEDTTEPMPTQMAAGTSSARIPDLTGAAHVRKVVLSVAAGSAIALALGVAFLFLRDHDPAAGQAPAAPPVADSVAPAKEPPPAVPPSVPSPSAASPGITGALPSATPPPSQSAGDAPKPPASAEPPSATTAPPHATGETQRAPASPAPHPHPSPCSPPYTVDSSGFKHYKRECMK
jgi:hypothetical protein